MCNDVMWIVSVTKAVVGVGVEIKGNELFRLGLNY
jgi:hypothetical protein